LRPRSVIKLPLPLYANYFIIMEKDVFSNRHYNTPGHAHELTFSVYRRFNLFENEAACKMFLDEIALARAEFKFCLWAYVVMPNHVHLLIWPLNNAYKIEVITKTIKGRMAKKYVHDKTIMDSTCLKRYKVVEKGVEKHRIWQRGGGFDRNLWNPQAIHQAIEYIEANPVRKKLAENPEKYRWSSAYAKMHNEGVVPDGFNMSIKMANPQNQRIGFVG
jgi:putative transposase